TTADLALLRDEQVADRLNSGDVTGRLVHGHGADGFTDVDAVERHARVCRPAIELDVYVTSDFDQRVDVFQSHATFQGGEGDRAVHCAGVQVGDAKLGGELSGGRAFS